MLLSSRCHNKCRGAGVVPRAACYATGVARFAPTSITVATTTCGSGTQRQERNARAVRGREECTAAGARGRPTPQAEVMPGISTRGGGYPYPSSRRPIDTSLSPPAQEEFAGQVTAVYVIRLHAIVFTLFFAYASRQSYHKAHEYEKVTEFCRSALSVVGGSRHTLLVAPVATMRHAEYIRHQRYRCHA